MGQLRLKIMTLGPSHKLDGEEEISLGSPNLLIPYGKVYIIIISLHIPWSKNMEMKVA
jgi:hypothetical protein